MFKPLSLQVNYFLLAAQSEFEEQTSGTAVPELTILRLPAVSDILQNQE